MVDNGRFRPDPQKAVLVVIDIQDKLARVMPESDLPEMIHNTNVLIATAKELKFPILVTEQYPRGLGPTVKEVRDALGDVTPIEKLSFSCCAETRFMQALQATGARDVLLCGMETHVCLMQTALDLLDANYHVFAAADGMCSRKKLNWELALDEMRQAGVVVGSTETFLFQMLRVAGTESFKKLSALLK